MFLQNRLYREPLYVRRVLKSCVRLCAAVCGCMRLYANRRYRGEREKMNIENAYRILFLGALIWFSILLLITLFRAIIGPRVTDRILSINMICTMVIACTCILAYFLNESYLFDVALLYALISFITVLILSATYIPKNPTRGKFDRQKGPAVTTAADAGAEYGKEGAEE